jgi:hypothetical protein
MPGLLDLFNSPEGQLGFSLLSAAAPSMTPMNGASRLALANQTFQGFQDNALKNKLTQAQLENYNSEVELRKQQVLKAQQLQDMVSKFFSGGATASAVQPQIGTAQSMGGVPMFSSGITTDAASSTPRSQPAGLAGKSIDQIAALKAAGGPDLLEAFKWVKDPLKMEQGSTYVDRTTGQERVMPKIGEGMAMGPGGVYGALPGYAQGQASIEGAKAQATEEAKARLNPLPLGYVDSGTGRPVGGSTYDYLKPKQAQPAMTPELEAFIRADAAKNGIPNPVANFTGGSRFDLAKPSVMQGLGQLQSAAEAKAAEAKALQPIEAGNKINDAWLKTSYEPVISQGGAANDMLTNVAVARQSMRNMGGTGWGTEAKATGAGILAGLGIATKNAELYASNAQTFQSAAMTTFGQR